MPENNPESADTIHRGVQALYETHWSHNWSDLPPEQERLIEEAFERVQKVHDMQEGGR